MQVYPRSEVREASGGDSTRCRWLHRTRLLRTQTQSGNSIITVAKREDLLSYWLADTMRTILNTLDMVNRAFKARPNAAHNALAWLSIPANRTSVAPDSTSFTIITQNVDGLSPRAAASLSPEPASSEPIIEMHGRISDTICTTCNHRESNKTSPICEALRGTEDHLGEADWPKIKPEDLPRCGQPGCDGMLRPGVIWFGENIMRYDDIEKAVERADLCLVLGTSSTVSQPDGGSDSDRSLYAFVHNSGLPRRWFCVGCAGPRRESGGVQLGSLGWRYRGRFSLPGTLRGNATQDAGLVRSRYT